MFHNDMAAFAMPTEMTRIVNPKLYEQQLKAWNQHMQEHYGEWLDSVKRSWSEVASKGRPMTSYQDGRIGKMAGAPLNGVETYEHAVQTRLNERKVMCKMAGMRKFRKHGLQIEKRAAPVPIPRSVIAQIARQLARNSARYAGTAGRATARAAGRAAHYAGTAGRAAGRVAFAPARFINRGVGNLASAFSPRLAPYVNPYLKRVGLIGWAGAGARAADATFGLTQSDRNDSAFTQDAKRTARAIISGSQLLNPGAAIQYWLGNKLLGLSTKSTFKSLGKKIVSPERVNKAMQIIAKTDPALARSLSESAALAVAAKEINDATGAARSNRKAESIYNVVKELAPDIVPEGTFSDFMRKTDDSVNKGVSILGGHLANDRRFAVRAFGRYAEKHPKTVGRILARLLGQDYSKPVLGGQFSPLSSVGSGALESAGDAMMGMAGEKVLANKDRIRAGAAAASVLAKTLPVVVSRTGGQDSDAN